MNIEIKQKNALPHSIKVAAVTLAFFVAIGLFARLSRDRNQETGDSSTSLDSILADTSSILIPQISLNVPDHSKENVWISALSKKINGKSEASVDFGRADVLTETYAVEVDFFFKWKEGLGQALHYGSVTGLIPVVALITEEPPNNELLKQIESLCTSKGVKVILLVPKK